MLAGDPTRGLKRLRTDIEDKADMLAALDAIDKIGGIEAMTQASNAQLADAQARTAAAADEFDAINGRVDMARAALVRAEDQTTSIRRTAEANAATIIAEAKAEAERIAAAAEVAANEKIDTAAKAAKRITDTAENVLEDARMQAGAIVNSIEDSRAELSGLREQINQANSEMRRIRARLDT
jgi:chromosome segregation ATPase